MKYRKLIGEITAKEINEIDREKPEIGCPNQDLEFIHDPTHEFKTNASYFADPMFSTVKKRKKRRRTNISVSVKPDPLEETLYNPPKSRRTTAVTSVDDFEDVLLTRLILKNRGDNKSLGIPSEKLPVRLADCFPSQTPEKASQKLEINNIQLKQNLGERTDVKGRFKKKKISIGGNKSGSLYSTEPVSPISKYLKGEKRRILNELKY